MGISKDQTKIVYAVSKVNIDENASKRQFYTMNLDGTDIEQVNDVSTLLSDKNISPNGDYKIYAEEVKIRDVYGKDLYPELNLCCRLYLNWSV